MKKDPKIKKRSKGQGNTGKHFVICWRCKRKIEMTRVVNTGYSSCCKCGILYILDIDKNGVRTVTSNWIGKGVR